MAEDGGGSMSRRVSQCHPTGSPKTNKHSHAPKKGSAEELELVTMPAWYRAVAWVVQHELFEVASLVAILGHIVLATVDADMRSYEWREDGLGERYKDPSWSNPMWWVFYTYYFVELVFRMIAERKYFFIGRDAVFNLFDIVLFCCDISPRVLGWQRRPPLMMLRSITVLCRLLPAIRRYPALRELWLMFHGIVGAMRAVFWAALFIFMVTLVMSVLSVEILGPETKTLVFDDQCDRCTTVFDGISKSVMSWFVLILVGDLWTDMAIVMMEDSPRRVEAIMLFTASYFLINMSVLNLILTVIVDGASTARTEDADLLVEQKQHELEVASHALTKICEEMDNDKSGTLTLAEVERGYEDHEEFANTMTLMDVDRGDLRTVFNILDSDSSGTVSYTEFVDQLHRMKTQESHTLLIFIRYYVTDIKMKLQEQMQYLKNQFESETSKALIALSNSASAHNNPEHNTFTSGGLPLPSQNTIPTDSRVNPEIPLAATTDYKQQREAAAAVLQWKQQEAQCASNAVGSPAGSPCQRGLMPQYGSQKQHQFGTSSQPGTLHPRSYDRRRSPGVGHLSGGGHLPGGGQYCANSFMERGWTDPVRALEFGVEMSPSPGPRRPPLMGGGHYAPIQSPLQSPLQSPRSRSRSGWESTAI